MNLILLVTSAFNIYSMHLLYLYLQLPYYEIIFLNIISNNVCRRELNINLIFAYNSFVNLSSKLILVKKVCVTFRFNREKRCSRSANRLREMHKHGAENYLQMNNRSWVNRERNERDERLVSPYMIHEFCAFVKAFL